MIHNHFSVSVHKTDRIDVNEKNHELPPDRGRVREYRVADYFCPASWNPDGYFIELDVGNAIYFQFIENDECACIPFVQKVNPLTLDKASLSLQKGPQNYLACPQQKWLDGYANGGIVHQFIITKSGLQLAVNENVLSVDQQDSWAIGFAFFAAKNPRPNNMPPEYIYPKSIKSIPHQYTPMNDRAEANKWFPKHAIRTTTYPDCWSPDAIGYIWSNLQTQQIRSISNVSNDIQLSTSGVSGQAVCCSSIANEEPDTADVAVNFADTTFDDVNLQMEHEQFDKAAMGAGGRIKQIIVTDSNSVDYYCNEPNAILNVYIALPEQMRFIMEKGKRQDVNRKAEDVSFGHINGKTFPLIRVS